MEICEEIKTKIKEKLKETKSFDMKGKWFRDLEKEYEGKIENKMFHDAVDKGVLDYLKTQRELYK